MMYIDERVIAVVFLLGTLMYVRRRQWDNAITRLFIALFYAALALDVITTMDIVRPLSRWFVFLLGAVEVLRGGLVALGRLAKRLRGEPPHV